VGGDSLPKRKPDPAPLLEAARQLKLDLKQILMVGDNIHDVEAAHAAGMRCVAVSYGYHHRPPSEFKADHLIDCFDQLLPLVINGNYYLDSETGKEIMVTDAKRLRCGTILGALSHAGVKTAVVTAKDKLLKVLAYEMKGINFSSEYAGKANLKENGIENVEKL